jgi:hypothetical protein
VSKIRERDMAGKRPAYVFAEVEITDAAVFQEYVSKGVLLTADAVRSECSYHRSQ